MHYASLVRQKESKSSHVPYHENLDYECRILVVKKIKMTVKLKPGAHEALVIGVQSPEVGFRYVPFWHWLVQHNPSLIKPSDDLQGVDVLAEMRSELQPRELHAFV